MIDCDRIVSNVFVGECPVTAEDVEQLRDLGITAVVNLQTNEDFAYWDIDWESLADCYRESGMEVRRVPVCDFDRDHLRRRLPDCVEALDQLLKAGHTVYVHCSAGLNRSPSTVVAYLNWILGWDFDRALQHVTTCRSCSPYVDAILLATEDRARREDPPTT
jgi:atypical dual specificity phosphatase